MKKLFGSIISVGLVLSMAITSFASDFTLGRSYTWSPYISTSNVTTYTSSIRANIEFFFDKAGADENNFIYYFTMEENCGDGKALVGDLQVSNIPDAHFDFDDDDKDGYSEESEVIEGLSSVLNTSTYYYFITWWDKSTTPVSAGNVNFIAQRSIWNPFGEYEAISYDLLTQHSYGALKSGSGVAHNTNVEEIEKSEEEIFVVQKDGYTELVSESGTERRITIRPETNTLANIMEYKANQESKLDEIRSERNTNAGMRASNHSLFDSNAVATLTFNKPISKQDLSELLLLSGAELVDCEAKLIDETGAWVTANVKKINSLDNIETKILSESGKTLSYDGITSARVRLNIMDDTIETLSDDDDVFFVDLMDEIVRVENNDYDGNLKVIVFDFAWTLDELGMFDK